MKSLALILSVALSALSSTARAQSATFTLPTDTIWVPGETTVGGAMTIEARILLNGSASAGTIIDEQKDAEEDKRIWVGPSSFGGGAWRGPIPPFGSVTGPTNGDPCSWTHVALVAESTTERVYVDGVMVGSRPVTGAIQNALGSRMAVGALQPLVAPLRPSFGGSIDWLRVSSGARYSGPLVVPPATQPASDGSTLLLYHFSEAPGSPTVADLGPNGWHGQLGVGFAGATQPALGPALGPQRYCVAGTSSSGCEASVCGSGSASATASTGFTLTTTNVEGSKDGLYFFGTNGRQSNPWGNGSSFQCVIPPVKRTPLLAGSGSPGTCAGTFARDFNSLWCPTCPSPGKNPGAGSMVQAQFWFRDPFNTSNQTTSLSDALEFVVGP